MGYYTVWRWRRGKKVFPVWQGAVLPEDILNRYVESQHHTIEWTS